MALGLGGFVLIGFGVALIVASLPGGPTKVAADLPSTTMPHQAAAGPAQGTGGRVATRARSSSRPLAGNVATSAPRRPAFAPSLAAATAAAHNLVVPAGFGPKLRRAWVAADPGGARVNAADVRSTLPGSVFYASQPAIGAHWAISRFVPTALVPAAPATASGRALLAEFRAVAIFAQPPGGQWTYVAQFSPGSCPSSLPAPVRAAWQLCPATKAHDLAPNGSDPGS